jgi:hypothetical protein
MEPSLGDEPCGVQPLDARSERVQVPPQVLGRPWCGRPAVEPRYDRFGWTEVSRLRVEDEIRGDSQLQVLEFRPFRPWLLLRQAFILGNPR